MLFNSFEFILAFLPVCLATYYVAGKFGHRAQVLVLALSSMIFYCGWDLRYVPLLLGSIVANYLFGRLLVWGKGSVVWLKVFLVVGLVFNIGILGYYKYANFLLQI